MEYEFRPTLQTRSQYARSIIHEIEWVALELAAIMLAPVLPPSRWDGRGEKKDGAVCVVIIDFVFLSILAF